MNLFQFHTGLAALALAISVSASPAEVVAPDIPNFHQVNDHVFRGAQPPPQAWQTLAKLGVKTVIDLRRTDEHSTDGEARGVAGAGMKYFNFPMKGVVEPSSEQVSKILALLDSEDRVFIHCKRGADRTGAVIACYRIAHDRWEPRQALNEAKSFGMGWAQMGLKRFVMSFQPKVMSFQPKAASESAPSSE